MPEQPEGGERQRLLRDGFWEETAVYWRQDGSIVVRKSSKSTTSSAPWALRTLKREVDYLRSLPETARAFFPPLKNAWGMDESATSAGYEIPFYADWRDGTGWLAAGPDQRAGDAFQNSLADIIFDRLHVTVTPAEHLGRHVEETIHEVVKALADMAEFRSLMRSREVLLNDKPMEGFPSLLRRLSRSGACGGLDAPPQVRLHGDLILENVLVNPAACEPRPEDLKLIDPVSVAGISEASPLFDLVKYESYATGQLLAVRSGWVDCSLEARGPGRVEGRFQVDADHPGLRPFRRIDMANVFRKRFESRYGAVDHTLYHLLDAYFSLVMALNTLGKQRQVRVLHALDALGSSLRAR